MKNAILTAVMLLGATASAEEIGRVNTKGIILHDSLTVEAFDDPDLGGVTCYATYYSRSLKLEDPSDTSLSCVKTGELKGTLANHANIFEQHKSVFFKRTVVDRLYDAKRGVLVYLAYTKDTDGKNAAHAISVVPVR